MAVREFNGTSDQIVLDNGILGQIFNGGALSIAMLVYPLTDGSNESFMSIADGSQNLAALYDYSAAGELALGGDSPSFESNTDVGLTASAWQVLGASKAGGSGVQATLHRKELGAGTWSHATAGATIGTSTSTATQIFIGSFISGGFRDMRAAWLAIWTSQLADADFENIESNATSAYVLTLSPSVLVEFNQASTGTAVTDLTGNGSDQASISGTTVVTGSDPAWTFGVGGTNATVDMTGVLAAATASVVEPPKPRPEAPFSEINVRL